MNTTESPSNFDHLENMTIRQVIDGINQEDHNVPKAVNQALPQIEALIAAIVTNMKQGGRLFYIGAGTSGRLGILDASECPPTFGVPHGMVIGLIAGGDAAIRKAVENAEDDDQQAWIDLCQYNLTSLDVIVGIAASGRTPYVIGGLEKARAAGMVTGAIVCNAGSKVAAAAEFPVEVVVGPEFLTGSTRMKSGTAQKLVLNMITTCVMIQLGKVKGNKMVEMQLSNQKLVERGVKMIVDELGIDVDQARMLLDTHGSVKKVLDQFLK